MIQTTIVLPEIPTREEHVDNEQFLAALQAWQNVCQRVVKRSLQVQPPPMPKRQRYLTTEQFLLALATWEGVFAAGQTAEQYLMRIWPQNLQ